MSFLLKSLRLLIDFPQKKEPLKLSCKVEYTKHYASRSSLGQSGERAVALYLENDGYQILARNFKVRTGEVDIIARKNEIVSFVEVKSRKKASFDLTSVITKSKQKKIGLAAQAFIMKESLSECSYRFDVATVCADRDEKISYIANAFRGW